MHSWAYNQKKNENTNIKTPIPFYKDIKTKNKVSLFKCEFLKYKNIIYAPKDKIEKGIVLNYKLPWLDKENLNSMG